MDTIVKQYFREEATSVLKCSVSMEDVDELEVELNEASSLMRCKSRDDFWATSYQMRKKKEFVASFRSLVKKYKTDTDRMTHILAQKILGKFIARLLVLSEEIAKAPLQQEPQQEHQAADTTDAAHRYFLGYILLQLGKKFGPEKFSKMRMELDEVEACGSDNVWWTAGINRGGLVFCTEEFFIFFKSVLELEDKFFCGVVKSTVKLMNSLVNNKDLLEGWKNLQWGETTEEDQTLSYREAIRLHVGGRSRSFVRFVKDEHKAAKRIDRSKKPLRKKLADLQQ